MAFGLNRVDLIGRLGADVVVNTLMSGGRVANLSIATDESYIDKSNGQKVDKTEWRARKRIRYRDIDPTLSLVFRGDDVIGRVFHVDLHAGGGFDLKFEHHPTVYGLDDWDQVEFIVKSVTGTDPHFA